MIWTNCAIFKCILNWIKWKNTENENLRGSSACKLVGGDACDDESSKDKNLAWRGVIIVSLSYKLGGNNIRNSKLEIAFTSDISHEIVMTLLAFFNQQHSLFRKHSVKSAESQERKHCYNQLFLSVVRHETDEIYGPRNLLGIATILTRSRHTRATKLEESCGNG